MTRHSFKISDILTFTNLQGNVANKKCKEVYTKRTITR